MDDMKNIITEATILVGEIPDDGTEGIGAPLRRGIDALLARVAELENAIFCGFKSWSEGGIYAEVVIGADFFETLKHHPWSCPGRTTMPCAHKFRVDTYRQSIPDGAETQECTCIKCGERLSTLEARVAELEAALEQIRTAIIAGSETGTIVDTLWMASGTDTVVDFIDSTLNRR